MIYFSNILQQLRQTLNEVDYSSLFVLTDTNTSMQCLPVIKNTLGEFTHIEMQAGETNKNLQTCEHIWEFLLAKNADRNSLLICLGGGVVTDLGSFVAGCYKRGIRYVNIPTSLLAMVDASVGSKAGIDFGGVKNSIGLFHQAEAIFIDPIFLESLPHRHLNNGKAEIIKHGLIASSSHFANFTATVKSIPSFHLIKESISIKSAVVTKDPKEKGLRKILNFGHTLGHAVEAYSLQNESNFLLHGEAIAIGMIAEAWLSVKYCKLSEKEYNTIVKSIKEIFSLPNYSNSQVKEMMLFLLNDKKNKGNNLCMSLLDEIGLANFNIEVSEQDALAALQHTIANHP